MTKKSRENRDPFPLLMITSSTRKQSVLASLYKKKWHTASTLRERCRIDSNMPLQYTREASLLVWVRFPKVIRARHIRGAIPVLTARIAQVDQLWVNDFCGRLVWLVVDDGAIGSSGRDGIKGKPDKVHLLCPEFLKVIGSVDLVENSAGL